MTKRQMPFVSIESLAKKGQPWEGTQFEFTDGMNVKIVVGPDRKPILDENGNKQYELKPGRSAEIVTFLGQTPDKTELRFKRESTGEEDRVSTRNTTLYAKRLGEGGRRKTRRRKTRRARKH